MPVTWMVGHIIKPWRTVPRGKLGRSALIKLRDPVADVSTSVTSYLGLMRASSGRDTRIGVCRAAVKAGYSVDQQFRKIYPKPVTPRNQHGVHPRPGGLPVRR